MAERQDFKVIKLEKDNYVVWKWQFQNVAGASGLGKLFEPNITIDAITDRKGLALLGSALSEENILKIINCTTFKSAWVALQVCFENKTAYEPQSLYRRLMSFKISSAADVSKGISEIRGIAAQLMNLDEAVSDNCLIGAILSALPSEFEIFRTVWKNSSDQSVDSLISKVMAEANDQASKHMGEATALAVKKKQNGKPRTNNDQCRYCKENGHWVRECPVLRKNKSERGKHDKEKKGDDDKQGKKKEGNAKSLAFMSKLGKSSFDKFSWVADSGSTKHMSPFKEIFSEITMYNSKSFVYQADDDTPLEIKGVGQIVTTKGTLKDVLFVPQLGQNLFSIMAASKNGLTYSGNDRKLTFFHENREMFCADQQEDLYIIKFVPKVNRAFAATLDDWHARFGHVNNEAIKVMHKNQIVNDLNIVIKHDEKCESCKMNKCTKASHPARTTSKTHLAGSVLHVDTAGPSNIASPSGSKYLVLCKDEASKYRQVAFVSQKNQITVKVKEFVSAAQLETGNSVLKLVTDNGTEYVNNDLQAFLSARGIIHERSVPYTPTQNGFIERDIRSIKESARSMLSHSGLDKKWWAEAVNCAVYALNRMINSSNNSATPYELWFGSKPSVKNLRVFGEQVILKKPEQKVRNTWDERGQRATFIGYTSRFNTYRFLQDKQILISCDAVFLDKMHQGKSIANEDNDDFWLTCVGEDDHVNQGVIDDNQPDEAASDDIPADDPSIHSSSDEQEQQTAQSWAGSLARSVVEGISGAGNTRGSTQAAIDVDLRNIVQVSNAPTMTSEQVRDFVTNFSDRQLNLRTANGTTTLRPRDLVYSESTGRWKNRNTGHFISRAHIKVMADTLRGSQNRACKVNYPTESNKVPIPTDFQAAVSSEYKQDWISAMEDEMESLRENHVFEEIAEEKVTRKPIGSRWVFTIKLKKSGAIEKFKARVVAKGFTQVYGIDYLETYCSVVHIMSTRLIINYAAKMNLHIRQFDIKTAFLYGSLKETIHMTPPEGFGKHGTLWKLNRSLYGLKQSPRMWNERFANFLSNLGLKVTTKDNSVFYRLDPIIIVIVYVDDGLIFGQNQSDIDDILLSLKGEFKMREMDVTIYRGLEIEMMEHGIFIHQTNYALKILKEFNMEQAKPADNPCVQYEDKNPQPLDPEKPYRRVVGSLSYLSDTSRPDLAYAVNQLQRQQAKPTEHSWRQVKQVLKYLGNTIDLGILYKRGDEDESLIGYSDSDFAGDWTSSKSTTGYVVLFNGAVFHWKTQLQRHVTLSSTEAEVIALCTLSKDLWWIRDMMIELGILTVDSPALLRCDNSSAICIAQSERSTNRTRHLRAQEAYVLETIAMGELIVKHVKSENQIADMLTKVMQTGKFVSNRNQILKPITVAQRAEHRSKTVAKVVKSNQVTTGALLMLSLMCLLMQCSASTSVVKYVQIDINSPCEPYAHAYRDRLTNTHWQKAKWLRMDERDTCEKFFQRLVMPALKGVDGCDKRQLKTKRGIFDIVGQTARLVSGVTDFISSAFESPVEFGRKTLDLLKEDVEYKTWNYLSDYELNVVAQLRDTELVSSTAKLHEPDLRNLLTSEAEMRQVWSVYHLMREVLNGVANLRGISYHCSNGHVATNELAELVGDPSLREASPENTILVSVDVNLDDWIITIGYQIELPVKIEKILLITFCATVVIVNLLYGIYRLHTNLKRKRALEQIYELTQTRQLPESLENGQVSSKE